MVDKFPEFSEFDKIPRLNREIVVTEKIDGTNAQIYIAEVAAAEAIAAGRLPPVTAKIDDFYVFAGSRSKWISPRDDNHGFARWVEENAKELLRLGPGAHFGEWWGGSINKRYSQWQKTKKFSLFNTARWGDDRPACCDVVPVLYPRPPLGGPFSQRAIEVCIERLREGGSVACPGCPNPEGIVVFHTAANMCFKVTLEKDNVPKGLADPR